MEYVIHGTSISTVPLLWYREPLHRDFDDWTEWPEQATRYATREEAETVARDLKHIGLVVQPVNRSY